MTFIFINFDGLFKNLLIVILKIVSLLNDCHYAWHPTNDFIILIEDLWVILLSLILLYAILQSVIFQNAILQHDIVQNAVLLNVILLNFILFNVNLINVIQVKVIMLFCWLQAFSYVPYWRVLFCWNRGTTYIGYQYCVIHFFSFKTISCEHLMRGWNGLNATSRPPSS